MIVLFLVSMLWSQESKMKKIRLKQTHVENIGTKNHYTSFGLSGNNKQQTYFDRLREMITTPVPSFIKREIDGLKLFILDQTAKGYMALYRSPLSAEKYHFKVLVSSDNAEVSNKIDLLNLVGSKYNLEVQDVRLKDDILYFNAPSVTYASSTKGKSAALYAYDLLHHKLLWKSHYLVSNNIFLVEDDFIVSGYGFTAERDWLYILDRASGKVLAKKRLDSAPYYLEMQGNKLFVITYNKFYTFEIE